MNIYHFQGLVLNKENLPYASLAELIFSRSTSDTVFLRYLKDGICVSQISYSEFSELSLKFAGFLQRRFKVSTGSRVIVQLENSDCQLIAYAALMIIGAVIVPINPAESDEYILKIITHSEAILCIGERGQSMPSLAELRCMPECFTPTNVEGDFTAAMFYTSGTTGNSKAVCLSHHQLLVNSIALSKFHKVQRDSIHFCVLPLFHVNAFGFSFLTTLYGQGRLVLNSRFQSQHFWKSIRAEGAQIGSIVPEIVRKLLSSEVFQGNEGPPDPLKYLVCASSPLARNQLVQFTERFKVPLIQGYGLSEAVNFSMTCPTDLDPQTYERMILKPPRPTVGVPLWGNEVAVLDPQTSQPVPEGEVGEIAIRGWNVMQGYYRNDAANEQAFRGDWLHTGDLGYSIQDKDRRSFYFISGRIKNTAKRNSETIALEEIEDLLKEHPGFEEIAALGFPNDSTGEEVGLAICRSPQTPGLEEIHALLREKLAFYKRPKVVLFVEQIPKTGSMKIQRRFLLDHFVKYQSTHFKDSERHAERT